ncbi:signal peptidase II, partial [Klebsiella pneumoniae]
AIIRTFAYGEQVEITPFFNLVHVLNPGAAFSFLANAGGWQRYFFITLGLAVSAWLGRMLCQQRPRLEAMGYSLILGGALGNVADRVLRGQVVDFLDFHWRLAHWPAFNLADVAITIG